MAKSTRKLIILLSLLSVVGVLWASSKSVHKAAIRKPAPAQEAVKLPAQAAAPQLIDASDGVVVLEWSCPKPELKRDPESGEVFAVEMPGLPPVTEAGVPLLPQQTELLDCLPGAVSFQILEIETETENWGEMLPQPEDILVDSRSEAAGSPADPAQQLSWEERAANTERKADFWPQQHVELEESGDYRGHRLMALRIYPVRVNARSGEAVIVKYIKVQVTLPRGESAVNRLPDRGSETRMLENLLGVMAPTARRDRAAQHTMPRGRDAAGLDAVPGNRYVIVVNRDGVYRVYGADLLFREIPIQSITPIDLHLYNNGAEVPIHVVGGLDGSFDEEDYFEFYGLRRARTYQAQDSSFYQDPYTEDNKYWMFWGDGTPGLRMGLEDGSYHATWIAPSVDKVRATDHFEIDDNFQRLAYVANTDTTVRQIIATKGPISYVSENWFWGDRIQAFSSQEYLVNLTFPYVRQSSAPGQEGIGTPVTLRAALHGFSWGGGSTGSHRAVVSINGLTERGLSVGKISLEDNNLSWTGQRPIVIESNPLTPANANITSADLYHGVNIIRVEVPGDGLAGDDDQVMANWFEVEYDRLPRARNDELRFHFDEVRGDTFLLNLRGFSSSNIQVWKIGRSRLENGDVQFDTRPEESASWAVRFNLISNDAYDIVAFANRAIKTPFMIYGDSLDAGDSMHVDLRSQQGAEYLIITHDSFLRDPALIRLDSLRRAPNSFNGSVLTIPLSEVYEQFAYGAETPEAIYDFLKYAYENWTVRPTHCCLVGDAVLLQRYNSNPGNLVPTVFPTTLQFGIAAGDMLFGCVAGPPWDIIPDIAVGRISVRTPEELDNYVQKVIEYQIDPNADNREFESPFRSRVLMVSDKNDAQFNFVTGFTENTIRLLPDYVHVERLYLDSLDASQGFATLRRKLQTGSVIVNYNGHGGGGVWSGTELINTEGVPLLFTSPSYPLVTNFTCYVGAFDDQESDEVLSEAFLYKRNVNNELVGATGFYSSSGVGWANAGRTMQSHLFNFVMDRPARTYGEIVQENKARFWAASGGSISITSTYSMMMMMNLLGDPGIRLALPDQEFEPEINAENNIVEQGQTVYVSGTLPWTPSSSEPTFIFAMPYNDIIYSASGGFLTAKAPAFDQENVTPQFVSSQHFDSIAVPITSRFITPRGHVTVYASDPFNYRDAVGAFPIYFSDSLTTVQIFDVTSYPSPVVLSDSAFSVQATILHQDDIASVYMRGIFRPAQGPVVIDTMYMTEAEPGIWRSDLLGPYHVEGGSYRVKFYAQIQGGELYETENYDLTLQSIFDFKAIGSDSLPPVERPLTAPTYWLQLRTVRYAYSPAIEELKVRLTAVSQGIVDGSPGTVDSFTVDQTLTDLNYALSDVEVYIPTRFRPLPYTITVTVDPFDEYEESDESNNTLTSIVELPTLYPATRALGTFYPATPLHPLAPGPQLYWAAGTEDTLSLRIAPSTMSFDSVTLIYHEPRYLSPAEVVSLGSAGLRRLFEVIPSSRNEIRVFKVTNQDSTEFIGDGAEISVEMQVQGYDTLGAFSLPTNSYGIFQHLEGSDAWWRLPESEVAAEVIDTVNIIVDSTENGNPIREDRLVYQFTATGTTNRLGEFAVFKFLDEQGPSVQIAVGGMNFTAKSYVPRNPEIYATISDPMGVDRGAGKFYMILDGDTIPEWQLNRSDTLEWGGTTSVLYRPELEPGDHTLDVFATDNVGNTTTHSVEFTVRGDFGIEWALNYPNPFSKTTTIAYVLTGATDDYVQVKIYTVAGRLIRTLRDPDRETANYRELAWDGRDEKGEEVANGVYFAKIKAKRNDDEIEKVVKIAKVR